MAEEELQLVSLRDDFYRDGFYKAFTAFAILFLAIGLLIAVSLYLHFSKPAPVVFGTGDGFRTVAVVPVNQSYLKFPQLAQWASEVVPKLFTYDFVNYDREFEANKQYFAVDGNGWKAYLNLLKLHADATVIKDAKLFANAKPGGAPFLVNQGVLPNVGIYAWWIQMPLDLSYSNGNEKTLTIQALIIRVPTLDNINGVAIENILATQGGGNQVINNG